MRTASAKPVPCGRKRKRGGRRGVPAFRSIHDPAAAQGIDVLLHAGINASYLSRLFHQARGETLIAYVTAVKMDHAYRLLRDPDMRMQRISQSLGFQNPAYFSFFFKKNAGLTPSEYRSRNLHEE
jgi:AraC-like DNA-binding protein